jgi:hypothetical protein
VLCCQLRTYLSRSWYNSQRPPFRASLVTLPFFQTEIVYYVELMDTAIIPDGRGVSNDEGINTLLFIYYVVYCVRILCLFCLLILSDPESGFISASSLLGFLHP